MRRHAHRYARVVLPLLASASAAAALFTAATAQAAPPNIVFFFTDDHAYQAISAYDDPKRGPKLIRTPNIDRLAREGARFTQSFVTNSLCTPSRAVLLTGKWGHLTGVRNLSDALDPKLTTFPELLRKAGYQTAVFGKWHLGRKAYGFDRWEILPGQGKYYNPTFLTEAGEIKEQGHVTDIITKKSLAWLESRDRSKPFVLLVNHKAPHRDWEPAPDELKLFARTKFPLPATFFDDYAGRASPARNQEMMIAKHATLDSDLKIWPERAEADAVPPGLTDDQKRAWLAAYRARIHDFKSKPRAGRDLALWKYQAYMQDYLRSVAGVERSVGQVLAYLDKAGLGRDTVVIYGSDQGFFLGEHGWFDKRWMYEESFRTPLLVRWPGIVKPGVDIDELVQNLDYAQTVLDIAGVPALPDMQGASLVPLLKGERPKTWRHSLYYQYYDQGAHAVAPQYGVRTRRFKLIHFPVTSEWELFDLEKDPRELRSVYDDPRYAFEREALTAELARLRQQYKVPANETGVPRAAAK